MTNLLFFTLGFITHKLINILVIYLRLYLDLRKRRGAWVRQNFDTRLNYDKRLVR
jgi:hypothetical protein